MNYSKIENDQQYYYYCTLLDSLVDREGREADVDELKKLIEEYDSSHFKHDPLYVYTICDHPRDHPNDYTVRRHLILPSGAQVDPDFLVVNPDLEKIRDMLRKKGLYCLGREASDDPVILESWI